MLFPWRNYEVNIIFSHGFKFYMDYEAEGGGKVLLKRNDVETVCLLSKGDVKSQKLRVEFSLEDMDMDGFKKGATYNAIRD